MTLKFRSFTAPRFRPVMGVFALVCGLSHSTIQAQTIQFDALAHKGAQKSEASCVRIDAKTIATIVAMGSDMKKATLITADGKKIPLVHVVNDVNSRLSIYTQPSDSKPSTQVPATFASSLVLKPSQPVFTSASDHSDPSRIVARVTRFQGKILPLAVLRVNHSKAAPKPGTGIYNEDGKLIAIVRQSVFGDANSSYCLPVEVITRTIRDQKIHGQVSRCWIGIVMDELVAPPIVESVRPSSPAKKAGLKNGDVILKIGAREVRGYSEVVDAFFYLIAGKPQVFKILRGTEIKEVTILPEVNPRVK